MSKPCEKYDEAEAAITEIFNDQSLSTGDTLQKLSELSSLIEGFITALEEENDA